MSNNFWIENAEDFLYFEHPSERDVLHPLIIDKVNKLRPRFYLDFGAGDGRMSQKIEPSILIDIFDISEKMINQAKEILGTRLNDVYRSLSDIPENYYDVIVCSMVLPCIETKEEHKKVLNSIHKSLKPGGVCIFSTTHPCFRQSFFSDFFTEYSLGKEFNYFNEGKSFEVTIHNPDKTNKVTFEDHHWSLSFTLNSIVEAKFNITETIETEDDKAIEKHNKTTSPFLIIIGKK